MLREGIEDYEFLYRLRELLEQKRQRLPAATVHEIDRLLDVPAAITSDMTTFTKDPAPIYTRRAAIAAAIENLLQQ